MSLEIYDNSGECEIHWLNKQRTFDTHPNNVYWICAVGDELKLALQITGLPQYGSAMKFYGDTAKHIVGNWNN